MILDNIEVYIFIIKEQLTVTKILVTGSSGFIGSNLVEKLRKDDHEVIEYDLKIGKDILNFEQLRANMRGVEVCYHLAAKASHRLCMPYPREYFLVDALGTENVAEAARLCDVKSVVFTSSGSVYGSQPIPWSEESPVSPNGPYSYAKVTAEGIGKLYFTWYDINWKSIRCFNVVGPRCRDDTVVTIFYNRIVNNRSPVVYNKRGNSEKLNVVRDFTNIGDIVNGLLLASKFKPKSPEEIVFNMSAGYKTSILELAEMMIEMLNKKGKLKPVSGILKDHEPLGMGADSSKAEKLLGWGKRLTPRETITKYIHWRKTKNI